MSDFFQIFPKTFLLCPYLHYIITNFKESARVRYPLRFQFPIEISLKKLFKQSLKES